MFQYLFIRSIYICHSPQVTKPRVICNVVNEIFIHIQFQTKNKSMGEIHLFRRGQTHQLVDASCQTRKRGYPLDSKYPGKQSESASSMFPISTLKCTKTHVIIELRQDSHLLWIQGYFLLYIRLEHINSNPYQLPKSQLKGFPPAVNLLRPNIKTALEHLLILHNIGQQVIQIPNL